MHLQEKHYLAFDLDLEVNVTQIIAQYSLHYVTYPGTKFEVTSSNCLGGYIYGQTHTRTHTRTHARTDGRRTDFGTKSIYRV